jgi:hypothetical protein
MERSGTIRVERRPSLQDLVRRYTVFIDQHPVGKVLALQKASFSVPAGEHWVQLRIVNAGTSASAEFVVDVRTDETDPSHPSTHFQGVFGDTAENQSWPPTSTHQDRGSDWSSWPTDLAPAYRVVHGKH